MPNNDDESVSTAESDNDRGEETLSAAELQAQEDEAAAADLIWKDPLYAETAAERLALIEQIQNKNLDFSKEEYDKIFRFTFTQNDTKNTRADNLNALHQLVTANFAKIVKTLSFFKNVHASLADLVNTLRDLQNRCDLAGIDKQNTLRKEVEALQVSVTTIGLINVSDGQNDVLTDIVARTVSLERELDDIKAKYDTTKLEADIKEITDRFGTLTPVTMDSKINANITKLNTLQPLIPIVPDIKQLAEVKSGLIAASRIDARDRFLGVEKTAKENRESIELLRTENAQQSQILEGITADTTRVHNVLGQVKAIKDQIDQSPAGQSVHRSMLGTAKIPELKSLDPAEFRTWKDLFLTHVDLHKWSDDIATKALKLAIPDHKVYVPLKLATPDWETCSLREILAKWEKRCCPDSDRDLAITQLSQLHQGLDEASLAYIDRAVQLYTTARFEDDTRDPETDLQFIQRLINTFRDTRLKAPLRRRKPSTISVLRIALNEEMNIL